MPKLDRGKMLVSLCKLNKDEGSHPPSRLNQEKETVQPGPSTSYYEEPSNFPPLPVSNYTDLLYSRPYSMDLPKFNEYAISDSNNIQKVLSIPKDMWENQLNPVNLKKRPQNGQHKKYCSEKDQDSPHPDLLCNEEIMYSSEDSLSDFDSDDSVKDKDYVIPPSDTLQCSPTSESDQSINNSLPPTVLLPLSDNEDYVDNLCSDINEVHDIETQKTVDTLLSLSKNAINEFLHKPQHSIKRSDIQDEKEENSRDEVIVVIVIEKDTEEDLNNKNNAKNETENKTDTGDHQEIIEQNKIIDEVRSIETSAEENIQRNGEEQDNIEENQVRAEECSDDELNLDKENEPTFTKSGNLRKRKTYDLSLKARQLIKKTQYIEEHCVKEGCKNKCFKKCKTKISEEDRKDINKYYWALSWAEQRVFLKQSVCLAVPKRKMTSEPKRHPRRSFFFKVEGERIEVCKCFFLTTLGYKNTNDKVLYNTINSTKNEVPVDLRGKHPKSSFINREPIIQHIQSFNPTISHYRREHAPLRKYLPSDLNATSMYQNFIEKHPEINVSYDLYRKEIKSLNISFTQLGHEECEICEAHSVHCDTDKHDKDNLPVDCEKCLVYLTHKIRAEKTRKLYIKHKEEKDKDPNHAYYSTDLEKVIMLPRHDTLREVIFSLRITAFNQTFAPVGKSAEKPFAVLWHEVIAGRKQEDIISAFSVFLKHSREYEVIDLWLDNCGAQNKNWLLYFYLVHALNSDEFNIKELNLNYFETGHTFMSCDHFHHQVELSMKKMKNLHDFQDFVHAVSAANSGKVVVKEMNINDFIDVADYTSSRRIQTSSPRAYMRNIAQVTFKRGTFNLYYKNDLDGEVFTLNFLKDIYLKPKNRNPIVISFREIPRGIDNKRKAEIIKNLLKFMPPHKHQFWKNLPTN